MAKRKKKPKTISKLHKEAWPIFARLVKLNSADDRGYCTCVTCGTRRQWNDPRMHAGHFRSRRHKATLYCRRNVHCQCERCNMWGSGEQYKYGQYLDRTYGAGTAEQLCRDSMDIKQFSRSELEELIEQWKEELKTLGYPYD